MKAACQAALAGGCRPGVDYEGEYRVDWTHHLGEPGVEHPTIHSTFGYAAQMVVVDRGTGAIERVARRPRRRPGREPAAVRGPDRGLGAHGPRATRSTEDFPTDPETAFPTNMTLRSPRHPARQGRAADRRHAGRVARSPARRTASRASARSASCRRPARWPRRCTSSTARGGPRCRCAAAAGGHRPSERHHAGARLRPPPPLLGAGAWHAGPAATSDDVRRDPGAGVVAPGRSTRPRDDPVVGDARRDRGARVRDDGHHRPPREPERHRGQPRRHRRGVRRGRRAGGVRATGSPTATGPTASRRGLAENERFLRDGGRGHGRRATPRSRARRRHPRSSSRPGRASSGVGVHIHVAEGTCRSRRRHPARADSPTTTGCSSTASISTATLPGTIAHNPRSNMNNAVGYAQPARRRNPVVLGTDGIGADMLEEFRARLCPPARGRHHADAGDGVGVAGDRLRTGPGGAPTTG